MFVTNYSFLIATLASSVMIVAIYFLRKTRLFADTFGVNFMVLLYAMSFLRIFVPIEIPTIQIVLNDKYLLAPIVDVLSNRLGFTGNWNITIGYILGGALFAVTLALLTVFFLRQYNFVRYVKRQDNLVTQAEIDKFSAVSEAVFGKDKKLKLIKCDAVGTPMVTGMLSSMVLLPDCAYTDSELDMIFLHECTHIKNKDLLLKFLIHIYCCLFWWNPFVYLLKADMEFILELKCDNNACMGLSGLEKLEYIQAINNCARNAVDSRQKSPALVASGFVTMDGTQRHAYRLNNLLFPVHRTWKSRVMTAVASLVMVLVYALSFLFIWQPSYTSSANSVVLAMEEEKHNSYVSDDTNAYLVQQDDGNYLFYFAGGVTFVPESHVNKGMYHCYPIYDEPQ